MKLSERDRRFLKLLVNGARGIPVVWNEEYRSALSNGWVRVGFGGVKELTPAGRALLEGE